MAFSGSASGLEASRLDGGNRGENVTEPEINQEDRYLAEAVAEAAGQAQME